MIRVLFVDDEPALLNAVKVRLRRLKGWDLRLVESAEAALAELEQQGADVVVTDQNMLGMKGTELLEQVRQQHPSAMRVLVSGQSEGAVVHDGLRLAHQVLIKPYSVDDLVVAVQHLHGQRAVLESPKMQRVLNAIDALPTPRAVFQELTPALADPDIDLGQVARIAERDPALSLRLMKLANSAFYGPVAVTTVVRAVQRLGLSMVRTAVTYAQVMGTVEASLQGASALVEAMQQRALSVGSLALKLLDGEAGRTAYLAGLLHDVGGLVLLASFPELREPLFAQNPWPSVRAAREKQLLGFTHAEVGAYLLGLWGQSPLLVRGVAAQHAPTVADDRSFDVAGAVHVAQRLALEHATRFSPTPQRADFDLDYLSACGQSLPVLTERALGSHR